MAKDFYGDLQLGILGGGQLGRMLIQEAINFNVNVHILDPDKNAPCRKLCNRFECGDLSDFDTVYNFGKDLDLITIEIEKVNVDALEKLEDEGVIVYPQSRVIRLIQDKGLQKQFFKQNNIPTAGFQLISSVENLAETTIALPYIQKLRRDGYDGKGVKRISTEQDLETAFTAPSLIEELVDFEKEIAVIVARNDRGDVTNLPLGSTAARTNAVMINLLGEPKYEGLAKYDGVEDALRIEGVFVHLYGKKYTKPFRKMGHVCIVNDDRELAIKNARLVQEILKVKA